MSVTWGCWTTGSSLAACEWHDVFGSGPLRELSAVGAKQGMRSVPMGTLPSRLSTNALQWLMSIWINQLGNPFTLLNSYLFLPDRACMTWELETFVTIQSELFFKSILKLWFKGSLTLLMIDIFLCWPDLACVTWGLNDVPILKSVSIVQSHSQSDRLFR